MRRNALLGALVLCLTTAVVASASAARRDAAITLTVRPSVIPLYQPVTVVATIPGGASNGMVTVQFKECGLNPAQFRDVAEGYWLDGKWSASIVPVANGTFRATQGSTVSNAAKVLTRAHVRLQPTRPGRYRAHIEARQSFWHKRVGIERYDRRRSKWVSLRTVMLVDTDAFGQQLIQNVRSSSDEFALKLPKGTQLRAVFPLSQAKPCYAAGTSDVIQT